MLAVVFRCALAVAMLAIGSFAALAQSAVPTDNWSVNITTGNTFQLVQGATNTRRSLTIQNNNASDNCYLNVDGTVQAGQTTASTVTTDGTKVTITTVKASILLLPGAAYTRYYPYVPADAIVVTCASSGDSVYVDMQ